MSNQISASAHPLARIFSSDFDFVVPCYHQPYAWSIEQASELFDGLLGFYLREQTDAYLLGNIVLIKDEYNPLAHIINGQGRLTTLTILLSALAVQLSGDLRIEFEGYIRKPGREPEGSKPKPRLALREVDRAFFAEQIQSLQLEQLRNLNPVRLNNESQRSIQSIAQLLQERLKGAFEGSAGELDAFGTFLMQRCFLAVVSTRTLRSSCQVASVLNSHTFELLRANIIKNDVYGHITQAD